MTQFPPKPSVETTHRLEAPLLVRPVSKEFLSILSILSRLQLYCSFSFLLLCSCLEDCCVVASCMFCAVRSLSPCCSVKLVQVQSVIIIDNDAATWYCVLHMNGNGCFSSHFHFAQSISVFDGWRWLSVTDIWGWLFVTDI